MNPELLKDYNEEIDVIKEIPKRMVTKEKVLSFLFTDFSLIILSFIYLDSYEKNLMMIYPPQAQLSDPFFIYSFICLLIVIVKKFSVPFEYSKGISKNTIFKIGTPLLLILLLHTYSNFFYFDISVILLFWLPFIYIFYLLTSCAKILLINEKTKEQELKLMKKNSYLNLISIIFITLVFLAIVLNLSSSLITFNMLNITLKILVGIVCSLTVYNYLNVRKEKSSSDLIREKESQLKSKIKLLKKEINTLEDLEFYELYLTENNYKLDNELQLGLKNIRQKLLMDVGFNKYEDYKRSLILSKKIENGNEIENI